MIHTLIPAVLAGVLTAAVSPALAQTTFTAPRFEALEQQQQALEQRQGDALEKARRDDLNRALLPNPPITAADSAVRALERQRDIDAFRLQGEQDRAAVDRDRTIAEASLPNRRISRSSILVVTDPETYALPRAPKGQYYARVDGRFMLVDAVSEMVVQVLSVTPSDPTADVPAGPRPPLQPLLPISPPGH